jgi:protein SCO1
MRRLGLRAWLGAAVVLAAMLAACGDRLTHRDGAVGAWLGRALATDAAPSSNPWGAEYFPNPVVTTHEGRQLRFYDDLIKGQTVVVNTFFTVCSQVCPLGTAKMLELQRLFGERMGKDVVFISISIDPLRDSPEAMKAYAERYGVGKGWIFVTGQAADLAVIIRKLGLGVRQPEDPLDDHSATLMVGHEPSGQWMKHSVTDNPRFVAASIGTFLGWPVDPAVGHAAEARNLNIGHGEFLFRNGCSACHTVGGGEKIGPDLLGVADRRDPEWLMRFVMEPDRMIASGDPQALALVERYRGLVMPRLDLSPEDAAAVLHYVKERSTVVQRNQGPPAQTP